MSPRVKGQATQAVQQPKGRLKDSSSLFNTFSESSRHLNSTLCNVNFYCEDFAGIHDQRSTLEVWDP